MTGAAPRSASAEAAISTAATAPVSSKASISSIPPSKQTFGGI